MNLELFPDNEKAKRMMERITGNGFYDNSYVAKWLFEVMGRELTDAEERILELAYQSFPETATWGIKYHEQKYGIMENPALSIAERRRQVLEKRNLCQAMNPAQLEKQLMDMTGSSKVDVIEHASSYTFDVYIQDTDVSISYGKILNYIRKVKPSHMAILMVGRDVSQVFANLSALSRLRFTSFVYPRYNYPTMYLDGSWVLDGKYNIGGFKTGESLDFYPVFISLRDYVYSSPQIENKMYGIGKVGAAHSIRAKTSIIIRCPYHIGEMVLLQILKIPLVVLTEIEFEDYTVVRNEFNTLITGECEPNSIANISVVADYKIGQNLLDEFTVNSEHESALTIEHDWWVLDGTDKLDGSHGLNPWIKKEHL